MILEQIPPELAQEIRDRKEEPAFLLIKELVERGYSQAVVGAAVTNFVMEKDNG